MGEGGGWYWSAHELRFTSPRAGLRIYHALHLFIFHCIPSIASIPLPPPGSLLSPPRTTPSLLLQSRLSSTCFLAHLASPRHASSSLPPSHTLTPSPPLIICPPPPPPSLPFPPSHSSTDTDVRWATVAASVDDRTPAERSLPPHLCADMRPPEELAMMAGGGVAPLPKSRYESISIYLANCAGCAKSFNDLNAPVS